MANEGAQQRLRFLKAGGQGGCAASLQDRRDGLSPQLLLPWRGLAGLGPAGEQLNKEQIGMGGQHMRGVAQQAPQPLQRGLIRGVIEVPFQGGDPCLLPAASSPATGDPEAGHRAPSCDPLARGGGRSSARRRADGRHRAADGDRPALDQGDMGLAQCLSAQDLGHVGAQHVVQMDPALGEVEVEQGGRRQLHQQAAGGAAPQVRVRRPPRSERARLRGTPPAAGTGSARPAPAASGSRGGSAPPPRGDRSRSPGPSW